MSHEKDATGTRTRGQPLDVTAAQMEMLLIEIKTTNRILSKLVEENSQDAVLQESQGLGTLREAEEDIKVILPSTPPRAGSPNYFLISIVLVFMVLFFIVFVH